MIISYQLKGIDNNIVRSSTIAFLVIWKNICVYSPDENYSTLH